MSGIKPIEMKYRAALLLLIEAENLVIAFFFSHGGFPKDSASSLDKRVIIEAFPLSQLNIEIPLIPIEHSAIIKVNTEYPDYEMSYLLTLDPINRTVKVCINDMPKQGKSIITEEELNGINVQY